MSSSAIQIAFATVLVLAGLPTALVTAQTQQPGPGHMGPGGAQQQQRQMPEGFTALPAFCAFGALRVENAAWSNSAEAIPLVASNKKKRPANGGGPQRIRSEARNRFKHPRPSAGS